VDVQPRGVGARAVDEAVHDVGRDGDEGARRRAHPIGARPDLEGDLALEHVERVGVLAVHVQVGTALAGAVARPGERQLGASGEEDDRAPLRVGDRLAVSEAQEHRRVVSERAFQR
jgi:hypothetical protein